MAEAPNGDYYTTDDLPYYSYNFEAPTLSEIAEVLQNGMQPLFHEVNVDVASCPCLTKAPYNLVGVGLCGNTSILDFGHVNLGNLEDWNKTCNIRNILTTVCHDSFIIGSTYATKPYMPYYGHLIMNAMYRAPNDIRNESRIIFANRGNGQTKVEKLTNSDHMTITNRGTFFVSEGRGGKVIRVRAKGRKTSDTDIITSMQTVIYEKYQILPNTTNGNEIMGLGGVLRMKNGRVACNVMWDEYEEPIPPFYDFIRQQRCSEINLNSDMVTVGTILNDKPEVLIQDIEQRYGLNLYDRSEFHCFSNQQTGGQFINDITPDTTEYEGYFNVARKLNIINI